jgi:acetyl esterase/lipase
MATATVTSPPTAEPPQPRQANNGDYHNFKMLMMLLPKLPLIVRVSVMHVLRLSESAKYLDLRSALVVSVLRSFLEPSPSQEQSISAVQRLTLKDPGIKGRIWVSTYTSPPPPETDARDALMKAIRDMSDPSLPAPQHRTVPEMVHVQAEWTGFRAAASSDAPLPAISGKEMYHKMMAECTEPTTILYLHGGAYYLCDPSTHRPATKQLAKQTGGRCYSVRYRLAPQNPFPAALLDALVSYLTLLYPPPGAFHEAVKPEHLVLAGDR